jgi:hypothetical protein
LGWQLKISGDTTLAWHEGLTSGFSALLAVIDTPQAPRGLAILTNSPYNAALREAGFKALHVITRPAADIDSVNAQKRHRRTRMSGR